MPSKAYAPPVYIVDDDEAFRDSLRWLLLCAGYESVSFATAEAFLLSYVPGDAACLILDLRLPGMSGLDLQRKLKERGDDLPVVFVSGHADASTARQALANGACAFLRKPLPNDDLLHLVMGLMDERTARTVAPRAANGAPKR
jgi:FixJ family two-component response regulator